MMLKTVLKEEVFPALGCTEPIAVAYAASVAGKELGDDFEEMAIEVDSGVYKNGMAKADDVMLDIMTEKTSSVSEHDTPFI